MKKSIVIVASIAVLILSLGFSNENEDAEASEPISTLAGDLKELCDCGGPDTLRP